METPTIRDSLVGALLLAASAERQRRFHADVPIADATAEVFCVWDDFYLPGSPSFDQHFSSDELHALAAFDEVSAKIAKRLPDDLSLADFQARPEWREHAEAARRALVALGSAADGAEGHLESNPTRSADAHGRSELWRLSLVAAVQFVLAAFQTMLAVTTPTASLRILALCVAAAAVVVGVMTLLTIRRALVAAPRADGSSGRSSAC